MTEKFSMPNMMEEIKTLVLSEIRVWVSGKSKIGRFCLEFWDHQDSDAREKNFDIIVENSSTIAVVATENLMEEIGRVAAGN